VYVVKMTDGRQMLLPAIHQFVKQVNIEAKKIVIDTAGLIEGD
jgi:ribosomal 30S subunit maturation factor RimM